MRTNTFDNKLDASGKKFAVIRARFNEAITQGLLDGAVETLVSLGTHKEDIKVVEVPGAFELIYAAHEFASEGDYDAIICLGAIIKGSTTHDEHLAQSVYAGMKDIIVTTGVPVIAGVITTLNKDQAIERSSGEMNRGVEAAKTAVEICSLTLS